MHTFSVVRHCVLGHHRSSSWKRLSAFEFFAPAFLQFVIAPFFWGGGSIRAYFSFWTRVICRFLKRGDSLATNKAPHVFDTSCSLSHVDPHIPLPATCNFRYYVRATPFRSHGGKRPHIGERRMMLARYMAQLHSGKVMQCMLVYAPAVHAHSVMSTRIEVGKNLCPW